MDPWSSVPIRLIRDVMKQMPPLAARFTIAVSK